METPANTPTATPGKPCPTCLFLQSYRLLIKAAERLQSPLLLAIRLYWGWQFLLTGRGKLMNHGKVAGFFQSLHIPFPTFNAYLAGWTECCGGLLLLAGLGSRLVSLPLIFAMIIAYLTAEIDTVKGIFRRPGQIRQRGPVSLHARRHHGFGLWAWGVFPRLADWKKTFPEEQSFPSLTNS